MSVQDFFSAAWTELGLRAEGPLRLRFVIQPIMASVLAIRAGLRDAREGNPPFLWAFAFNGLRRAELLRQAGKDIGMVLALAAILDILYQWLTRHPLRLGQAIAIAILLALVPYLLLRAPVTRLARRKSRLP
ncbi:hypothetical protein [Mesorhizobium sp. ANAO-SY3R2]|uniref:hypothetical protein n=1 Tax=Mesorhizobium sp. ANAO-SY3R2 TaxID=3166644 RepID=UPI00366F014A